MPATDQVPDGRPLAATIRRCMWLAEGNGGAPVAPPALRELLAALLDLPWSEKRKLALLGTLLGRMPEEDSALIERLLQSADEDRPPSSATEPAQTSRRLDVLLVDDDPGVLRATARLLRSCFHIRTAESFSAAMTELRRGIPDVVVSDLDMPHGNGADLLTAIAEQHPSVRRVLYSGADCRALAAVGVAHVAIEKPAPLSLLLAAVAGGESARPTK